MGWICHPSPNRNPLPPSNLCKSSGSGIKSSGFERAIEAAREAYQKIQQIREGTLVEAAVTEAAPVVIEHYPQYKEKMPPCEASCPAGENIERTTYFIENQRFEEALENIKAENPFPGVCGRVCFHPCETNCSRIQYDEGIATNALERAAFDYADVEALRKPEKRPPTGKRVAIIGSGPAGMTCAYFLALLGHSPTVFEAQSVAGGVPRLGIPEYRLPRNVVDKEIKDIVELGVDIKLNTRDGKDIRTPCASKLRKAFGWGMIHEFCLAKFIVRKVWRQEWTREYAQEYLATRYNTGAGKRLKAMLQIAWELHVAEIERKKQAQK